MYAPNSPPALSACAWSLLLCGALAAGAAPKLPVTPGRIAAEQDYDAAKARYLTNSADPETVWQFARACFERADVAAKNRERAGIAMEGIAACRLLLTNSPKVAAAHYYLGMDLGQLARTKKLGALKLVAEMEQEWKTALLLDERFDFAGPHRNLGLLYRDAPAAPVSIGDAEKAEQHLLRAVELSPDYPENRLILIESHIKWKRLTVAEREDDKLRQMMPSLRGRYCGPQWEAEWEDWDRRAGRIQATLIEWRNSPQGRRLRSQDN